MREVFQEYGSVIITIIAIVSLIGVISAIIGTGQPNDGGIVYGAFQDLMTRFAEQAGVPSGAGQ